MSEQLQTLAHGRDACVHDICHLVRGTNGKLSLGMVIGRLGNGSEFGWIERYDPISRITGLYLKTYGASLGGRRSPKAAVQAPKYI